MGQLKKWNRFAVDSGDRKLFVSHCNSKLIHSELFAANIHNFRVLWLFFQKLSRKLEYDSSSEGLQQIFSATSRFSAFVILFIFFKVEIDINKHDLYSSIGILAHKCYKCNDSEETSSEFKRISRCKGIDSEEWPDEFLDTTLFELLKERKIKKLSKPNGFVLYVDIGCWHYCPYLNSNIYKSWSYATTNQNQT